MAVSKRPDGLVERSLTINRKRVHFYGKSVAEVNRKITSYTDTLRAEQEDGPLFEVIAEAWWKDYQKSIKPSAVRAYKSNYNNLLEEFTGYRMREISPALVALWGERMKAQGRAAKTAANARSVLSCIFKYWCLQDRQTYNPVTVTDLPRGMKRTRREPPTPAQLAAVKAHPEGFGLCAWLFMYTGCRLGEVLALQWRDVDFAAGTIRISKEVAWINNQPVIQTPKTEQALRTVPLLSPLCAVLEPQRGAPEAYILGGEKPLSGTAYQRRWSYYCRDIGIAHCVERPRRNTHKGKTYTTVEKVWKPDATAHQFRHEYASMLYEAGIGEMEAQRLMGHADITTTRRIYTHIHDRQLSACAITLEQFLSET